MTSKQETMERIAEKLWGYPLKDRGFDRLDFHNTSCLAMRQMLSDAYEAGRESAEDDHRAPGGGRGMTVEYIEFTTAAQLIAAIQKLAGAGLRLDEIYVKDLAGDELTEVALEQETLSDGSIVFNLILSQACDPNS